MKFNTILATGAASAFLSATVCVHAQNLNGTVSPSFYGSPLAGQTINTGFGNAAGGNDSAGGSELDAAYGTISGGNLYLFLAGNVENNGNHLNVFIAGGAAGGQNVLNAPATGTLATMNGSTFSPGFNATFAFDENDYAGTLYSEEYNLIGGTGGYVGSLANSGTGIYAGIDGTGQSTVGTIGLYVNNNNASTMGAAGAAYAGGAAVTTGYELVIPLSSIGYGGGNIMVLADVNGGGDSYLANQFLPGLPVGTGNVGGGGPFTGSSGGQFNFGSTPGEYFTVSAVPEPASMAMLGFAGLTTLLAIRRRK
ncbi:MAG TPA: PEP-CTERM sorting domain-containing protein [Verrucomicrobiae bacterium]|nr:PEP-CTERM sorting domain-containing protein [Verrucomicrobiae bacterium]